MLIIAIMTTNEISTLFTSFTSPGPFIRCRYPLVVNIFLNACI